MIKLKHRSKQILIPDRWSDLTPNQFLNVLSLCNEVTNGVVDMLVFRLKLLKLLTGYAPSALTLPCRREQIESNIFNLAMMLKFPVEPRYANPELLDVFTADLREFLKTAFPFDVYEPSHLKQIEMVGSDLIWSVALNIDFEKNLLPNIRLPKCKTLLIGPRFDTIADSCTFDTDLKTGEYIDAMKWSAMFNATNNEAHLDSFIATIYRPDRTIYDTTYTPDLAASVAQLPREIKAAVLLLFGYFSKQIAIHPLYSIFFSNSENSNSNPIGLTSTVFAISSDGLGTRTDILNWPITEFFNSMYYRLAHTVESMRQNGLDDGKISRELGMSLETLEKL